MRRALTALKQTNNFQVRFQHVSAHVNIYGNKKADILAKAAARRVHLAAARTDEQRQEQALGELADSIVAVTLNK